MRTRENVEVSSVFMLLIGPVQSPGVLWANGFPCFQLRAPVYLCASSSPTFPLIPNNGPIGKAVKDPSGQLLDSLFLLPSPQEIRDKNWFLQIYRLKGVLEGGACTHQGSAPWAEARKNILLLWLPAHSPLHPGCHYHTYHNPSSLELGAILPPDVLPLSWVVLLSGSYLTISSPIPGHHWQECSVCSSHHHDMGMCFMLNTIIAVFIITAYQWQGSLWYFFNALQLKTTSWVYCLLEWGSWPSNQGEPWGISAGGC